MREFGFYFSQVWGFNWELGNRREMVEASTSGLKFHGELGRQEMRLLLRISFAFEIRCSPMLYKGACVGSRLGNS